MFEFVLFALGGLVALTLVIVVLIAFVYAMMFVFMRAIPDLAQSKTNMQIRRYVSRLKKEGFAPTVEYVGLGRAIAVDPKSNRVFLANNKAMKLYEVNQLSKIETESTSDKMVYVMRITVRDLENPYFEIKEVLSSKRLRQIESLLSVMREPIPTAIQHSTRSPNARE